MKRQGSTGDLEKRGGSGSIRSTGSSASCVSNESEHSAMTNASESNASFLIEDETMDPSVTETYMGEWKNDKRSGYGISERSDGLRYEGEWYANKKYGYGVTTFSNGEKEEGKYKNNVLITSQKKKLFLMRSAKFRERIDAAVNAAQRASKIALQKSDIAINRTATARGKAEQADLVAAHAREDSEVAEAVARQYAPDFRQPGLEKLKERRRKYLEMERRNEELSQMLEKKPNPIGNHSPPNDIGAKPYLHDNGSYLQDQQSKLQNDQQAMLGQKDYQPKPNPMNYQQQPKPVQTNYQHDLEQAKLGQTNYQRDLQQQTKPGQVNYQPVEPQKAASNSPAYGWKADGNPGEYPPRQRPSLGGEEMGNPGAPAARRRQSSDRPYLGSIGPQSSKEYLEQYSRPPSVDPSLGR